jgi:FkbM family methyltransferase
MLMAQFHDKFRIVPDYENILECNYRQAIGPGTTVIDVGAHEGRHTAVFLDLVGPNGTVVAFEPLPHLAMALAKWGLEPRLKVHECALSDFSGRSDFVFMRGTPAESGLRERIANHPERADPTSLNVQVRCLDEFLSEVSDISFLKIDVEGAEVGCLRGAKKLLMRFRPIISVEYGKPGYSVYGLTARSLYDVASALDYRIADLFGAICPDLPTWERTCDRAYWDWLLIPRERATEWQRLS